MCTYSTEKIEVTRSSGKGPGPMVDAAGSVSTGWFPLRTATVYYDHPVHAPDEHTVNIDFLAPDRGPGARLAVELSLDTAKELIAALQATVERAAYH
ncbi:DUF6295 family protein [Pseudonocardia xishanensis]|uniref:DUF6295 family protein n=1 Tax=Pseudonocardia xishanensis TaxID=630995 RepID=A0ABP8RFW8_9PSEU